MTLEELNHLEEEECRQALFSCCGSTTWVGKMLVCRPFTNETELKEKAIELFRNCTKEDWLEAFSHHAKLGDRSKMKNSDRKNMTEWEKQEQAGTAAANDAILDKLEKANVDYENKFGFIYLLCATGKSASVMLGSLYERLPNDLHKEIGIAMEEQNKITKLRIEKLLS